MSLVRINLQLPVPLYVRCTSTAGRKGISTAAFMRQVLTQNLESYLAFPHYQNKEIYSFSCRLPTEVVQRLDIQAKQYGVSRNGLIRSALEQATRKPLAAIATTRPKKHELDKYWKAGKIADAAALYGRNLDELEPENIILVARMYIEMGEVQAAANALEIAAAKTTARSQTDVIFAHLLSTQAHIARQRRELRLARQLFTQALEISLLNTDVKLTASILTQLSTLEELHENIAEAIRYAELSHEYLNVKDDTGNYIKTYLRLSGLYALAAEQGKARHYLTRAEELVQQKTNLGKMSVLHFQARKGLINLRLGKIKEAVAIFTATLPQQVESNSRKELYFNLTNLAVVHIAEGNYAQGENLLSHALRIESGWLEQEQFSRAKAYYAFLQASSDANRAVRHLKGLKRQGEQPEFTEYIANSIQYIFGDKSVQQTAINKFHRLINKSTTVAIQKAAHHTLQRKQIFPLI